MMQYLRLVAQWRSPQLAPGGVLAPVQPRTVHVSVDYNQVCKTYCTTIEVCHPDHDENVIFDVTHSEELIAAKKNTFGHHLHTHLTSEYKTALAAIADAGQHTPRG